MIQRKLDKYTIDKVASLYEKFGNNFFSHYRRKRLNNINFTIISNNCWAGHCYRHFGLPYLSPTVGLYFFADEYIKFLKDLEVNIFSHLQFIPASESKYAKILIEKGQINTPIGLLNNDIEIVFLHYNSEIEAYEKWNRRVSRVNINNLIIKFSQMNLCEKRHIDEFVNLKFRKKILFLGEPYEGAPQGIVIKRYTNKYGEVANDTLYYSKHVNLVDIINK